MGILPTFKCIWVQQQNVRFGGFLYLFKVSEESNCFYHTYKYFQKPKKSNHQKIPRGKKNESGIEKGRKSLTFVVRIFRYYILGQKIVA